MPKRGEDEALKNESQPEAQSEEPEEIPENEPPVEDNDETEPPADEPTPVKSDTKSLPPSPPEPCIPTPPKPKPPPPNPRREPSLPPVCFKIYAQCNTSLASGFRGLITVQHVGGVSGAYVSPVLTVTGKPWTFLVRIAGRHAHFIASAVRFCPHSNTQIEVVPK